LPVTWQTRDIAVAPEFAKGADYTGFFLQQTPLGEGDGLVAGDDEVVEHLHVHQRQRLAQVARQQLVGLARLRRAGRMVMRESNPTV
jgi:hypothetical protein